MQALCLSLKLKSVLYSYRCVRRPHESFLVSFHSVMPQLLRVSLVSSCFLQLLCKKVLGIRKKTMVKKERNRPLNRLLDIPDSMTPPPPFKQVLQELAQSALAPVTFLVDLALLITIYCTQEPSQLPNAPYAPLHILPL